MRFGVEKGESPYDPEGAGAGIKSPNAVAVAASVGRCRTDSGFHDMEKVWVVVLGEEMESAVRTATEVYFASVPAFGREEGEDDFPAAGGNRALGAWGWYSESKSKPM